MGAENDANKNQKNEEKKEFSSPQNIPIEPSNPITQDGNSQNEQPNLNLNNNNSNLQNNGINQIQTNSPNSQILSNQQSIPSQNPIIPPEYIPPSFSQGFHIQQQSQYTQNFPSQYTQNTDLSLYIKNPPEQYYGTNQESHYTSTMSAQYYPSQNNSQQIPYNSQYSNYQYQPQSQFIQSGSIYDQPKNGQSEFIQSGSIYEAPKEGSLEYQSNQFQNLQNTEPYKDPFDIKESEEVMMQSQGEVHTSQNNQLDGQNTQNIKENNNENNGVQNENEGNNENGLLGSTVLETQLLGNEQKQNQNETNPSGLFQFDALKISKTRYLSDEEVNNIGININENNYPSVQLGETVYNTNYIENNINSINNNIANVGNAKDNISNIFGDSNVVSTVNIGDANNNVNNTDIFGGNNVASTINIGDANKNNDNNNLIGTNILGNNEFVKMSKTQYVKEDSITNNDENKNNLINNESNGEVDTEQKEKIPAQRPKVIIIEDEEDIQICPNMVSSFFKKLFG